MHSDGAPRQDGRYRDVRLAEGGAHWAELAPGPEPEPASARYRVVNYRDLPVGHVGVTVNFPMEVGGPRPGGQTCANGATRVVVGSHRRDGVTLYSEESRLMKLAMVAPLPAGCAVLRDSRAWHGGCPNLSRCASAYSAVKILVLFAPGQPGRPPSRKV